MPTVLVPPGRWERWLANFERSHGTTEVRTTRDVVAGLADDGSTFEARLPFSRSHVGDPAELASAAAPPDDWGVLLVRKGGFAIARLSGGTPSAAKVGQRHVQGRTKAGGQSQQRFARRRANQARAAYDAAADHAVRVLGEAPLLVVGGDRSALAEVLEDRRLGHVAVVGPWLAVPEPRRAVLDQAVTDAQSLVVVVENAAPLSSDGS